MKFSATTVYDYKRLLHFNFFLASNKKFFWILLSFFTLLSSALFISNLCFGNYNSLLLFYTIATWSLSLFFLFMHFILPRFTVKKTKGLNAKIKYDFEDSTFAISTKVNGFEQKAIHKYSQIQKIMQSKTDFYLFTAQLQCFIVDKSAFTIGSADVFIEFLKSKGVSYK